MADFKKIIDHPEKQTIITKLVSGETPKTVSNYLKDKYLGADEGHLRLSATLLQEFLDKYANQHTYIQKIIQNDCDSKLDKKIAESLLNNQEWKKRIEAAADTEINWQKKLGNVLTILESRAEQLFDLIQSNPEGTKTDYIFTKYLELLMQVIEKGDKIANNRPDVRIEHTYTIQMVEQQSVMIHEVIRRILERMNPDYAAQFMEELNREMAELKAKSLDPLPTKGELAKDKKSFDKLLTTVEKFDESIQDELPSENEEDDQNE